MPLVLTFEQGPTVEQVSSPHNWDWLIMQMYLTTCIEARADIIISIINFQTGMPVSNPSFLLSFQCAFQRHTFRASELECDSFDDKSTVMLVM
jgi:hypothetical protein